MWRALSATLLLSSTAAIAAETTVQDHVIWNEPMPMLLTAVGYTGIALGANLPVTERNDLVVEAMPFFIRDNCDTYCGSLGLFLAVGVAYNLGDRDPRSGFFVQPKLVVHAARHTYYDDYPLPVTWYKHDASVAVGVDLGYRMTFGHFFVAPVIGASVGYVLNNSGYWPRLITPVPGTHLGFDLNVHLLRIGVAF